MSSARILIEKYSFVLTRPHSLREGTLAIVPEICARLLGENHYGELSEWKTRVCHKYRLFNNYYTR